MARLRLERAEEVVLEMVLVVLVRLVWGRGFVAIVAPPTNSAIAPAIAVSAISAVSVEVVMAVGAETKVEVATTTAFFAKNGCKLDSLAGNAGLCATAPSFWFITTDFSNGTKCPNFASSASRPSQDGCARLVSPSM